MLKFVFLPLLKSSIVNQYSLIKVSGCCNTSGDPSVDKPSQARVSLLRDDTFFGDNGGGRSGEPDRPLNLLAANGSARRFFPPLPDPSDRVILNPDNHVFLIFNQALTVVGMKDLRVEGPVIESKSIS
jgi:hypothetical protein